MGAFVWSTVILQRQKKAWADYAKKHDLTYVPGRFMDSPAMSGMIGSYFVSCFAAVRDPQDMRARRWVSVVEVKFPAGLVGSGAVGTKDMLLFLEGLEGLSPMLVHSSEWREAYHFYTREPEIAKAYLTDQRVKHLAALLGVKNAAVLLLYDENEAIARVETPDPIKDVEKIEKVVSFVTKHAEKLLVDEAERKAIRGQVSSQ